MLRHYLTTALLHFARHKTTTVINIVGLVLGLTCFLAAHGVAALLGNSDREFANADRIHVLTQRYIAPGSNMDIPMSPVTAWPAGQYLQADVPELQSVARLTTSTEAPVSVADTKTFARIAYADPQFFEIFAWPFAHGDPQTALRDTNSVVLSKATATRLFGDPATALGKTVLAYGRRSLTVTAVLEPLHGFSHFDERARVASFDMLVPMDALMSSAGAWMRNNWNTPAAFTYVLLPSDGSLTPQQLRRRLESFDERHVPSYEWRAEFQAIPLSQITIAHLNRFIGAEKSGISVVTLLYALGALVLLVSALNYANLATAQAAGRGKEIGLRRVVGARRTTLAIQYVGEATLLTAAAALVAVTAVTMLATSLLRESIPIGQFAAAYLWSQLPIVAAVVLGVGALAGAYPAFVLSRITVAEALRAGRMRAGPRFVPALLVGVQFAATSFLVTAILVMTAQQEGMQRAALGRAGEPLVAIANDLGVAGVSFETLRTELLKQPHVRAVTAAMLPPWDIAGALMPLSTDAQSTARRWTVCNNYVNRDYLATMDIELVAGRDFDAARADDVAVSQNGTFRAGTVVIVDRALAQQSGWTPEQAIGKQLYLWTPGANAAAAAVSIIGVTENKALRLVGMGATSNLYMMRPATATRPILRIAGSDVRAALREVDAAWERVAPNIALRRRFADEVLESSLSIFSAITQLFRVVALLALFIAALGLISMSLHVIGRRTHEIGVRKSLGASVRQILTLLLKDFSKPVLLANLVSWPLAFVAMSVYLSIFVTRSALSPWPFAASLLVTLLVAWGAVIAQATRAARLKPATVLRYE
jgi:putative ABC transport system permease protein